VAGETALSVYFTLHYFIHVPASHDDADDDDDDDEAGDSARHSDHDDHQLRPRLLLTATAEMDMGWVQPWVGLGRIF